MLHLEGSRHTSRSRPDVLRGFDNFTAAIDKGYRICYCAKRRISGIARLLSSLPPADDNVVLLCVLYFVVASTELRLRYAVKRVLRAVHGDRWWRDGVPLPTRKDCAARREDDPEDGDDSDLYMDFIHYRDIIDKRWEFFREALPAEAAKDKRNLLKDLDRFNRLRNRVMHPSRAARIGRADSPERSFALEIADRLHQSKWRWAEFEAQYDG